MRAGVVVFPGSNCDRDSLHAVSGVLGEEARFIWHGEEDFSDLDLVILPGGFSYGDYLRTGAIARFSPVMSAVGDFADSGGLVLGICNGFQVLLESGLLPGSMIANRELRFICRDVYIKVERDDTPFSCELSEGEILRIPVAHFEGNYTAEPEVLRRIGEEGMALFRYCDSDGRVTDEANPNGSAGNIAGLLSEKGNVLGMMPHPERASESILGSEDGLRIFRSAASWLDKRSGVVV